MTKDYLGGKSCFSYSTDSLENRVNEANEELDNNHEIELDEKSNLLSNRRLSEDLISPDTISEENQHSDPKGKSNGYVKTHVYNCMLYLYDTKTRSYLLDMKWFT